MSKQPVLAREVLAARGQQQLKVLHRAEPALREGLDDGVHDTRVAARRLHAALGLLRPLVEPEIADRLRDELRWLARSLGSARDHDVVRARLQGLADGDPDLDALLGLLPHGAVALDQVRHAALLDTLDAFVKRPPWTPSADQDARRFLRRRLRREWRRLVGEVDLVVTTPVGTVGDEQLHRARKAAKRMRYALETAELVWPRKPRALRAHVHRLTDLLGERQDTVVTRASLAVLALRAEGEELALLRRLIDTEDARAAELEASFRLEWAARSPTASMPRWT